MKFHTELFTQVKGVEIYEEYKFKNKNNIKP